MVLVVLLLASTAVAGAKKNECTTIQSGELLTTSGDVITPGYDQWGYNYQAHMFNGMYCDSYRDAAWCQEWKDISLMMKWNEGWLSNKDCGTQLPNGGLFTDPDSPDGGLDRHYPIDSYIGSGAWLSNHQWGDYELDGEFCEWDYFVKIVAAPEDAELVDGVWYGADETEIGPEIWGAFAIIQEVENDLCAGTEGLQYLSPDHAGFGGW